MLVMDGLGGLPLEPGGKTELETARTPNLDRPGAHASLGLTIAGRTGHHVESGPGHLAIFGYDPLEYRIGRGVLEAVGVDFDLGPRRCCCARQFLHGGRRRGGDRPARRALPTAESKELSKLLSTRIEDVEFFVETVKEHRLAFVMRGGA